MRTEFDIAEFTWDREKNILVSMEIFGKHVVCSQIYIQGKTKKVRYQYNIISDRDNRFEFSPTEIGGNLPKVYMRFAQ